MKLPIIILSFLLLLASYSYGQRYRLVADSSYRYDKDVAEYEVEEINKYVYNEGNEWMTLDGQYFYFDTMYHYKVYGGDATLIYKHARVYDKYRNVQKEIWYERFPLEHDEQTDSLGEDSILYRDLGAYKYYQNSAHVPVRIDSFVYDERGRITEKYIITTTTEFPLMVPNRYCESYPDGEYKLYLWEHTTYKYHQRNCVEKIIKAYNPKGDLHDQTNVRHVYDKDELKSTDSVVKDGWSTYRVLKHYRKNKIVGIKQLEYEDTKEDNRYSQFWIKGTIKNGVAKTSYWVKDKGDVKLLYTTVDEYYDTDSFKVKSEYKEYYLNGNVAHHHTICYRYNNFGLLKEKYIEYKYRDSYSDDKVKSGYKQKHTYTYEAY